MSPFPLLLILIALIRRPWPRWLQDRICDTPVAFHRDGSVCRSRWCLERGERRHL
jgi:hypothetical protein